ncbi:MAG TPA: NADH:flavin oxidoreductase [Quisquiliibacterium sp.]|nr:NADH:flavin oxidoreductase [Quisquiliibacterium sp.]
MTQNLSESVSFPRGPAMKNRFMLAPLTNFQSHADGTLSDDEYNWLVKRATGGFGLTMTCAAHVQANGQGFQGQLGIWSDKHLAGLERFAKGIRAQGSVSSVQLHHAGLRANPQASGLPAVAPWDDADSGARALSTGEVEQLVEDFIVAALRAERAGFDGVELHGAHGYLLCEFLDPVNNQRSDRYGGSFENRSRVFREIIDGIRARAGANFQVGVRISPERFNIDIGEAREFARQLMTCGKFDYLDMSLWDCFKEPEHPDYKGRALIDLFTDIERGGTPLGVAGKIMDAATAQKCLDHGADFVLIGRGAILHHDFPKRALADAAFRCVERPVTREYLRAEGLGQAFVDYLATGWKGFVAD